MKRLALLFLLALMAVSVPAFAQITGDVPLLGFTGYDYENPNGAPGTYLAIGDGYNTVGFVTEFVHSAFLGHVDPIANEYTYFYTGLIVDSYDFTDGLLFVTFASPGRGRFYEDPRSGGTSAAQYGANPPNVTAPSSFVDGTLILGGSITNMWLYYDYVANTGAFNASFTMDEGSLLGLFPANQRDGWTIAGLAGRPNPTVPDGYDHQISGENRVVPTRNSTWSTLKSLYR